MPYSLPPIPATATLRDPEWSIPLQALANELILLGARPAIVRQYVDISVPECSRRIFALTGRKFNAGNAQSAKPAHYLYGPKCSTWKAISYSIFADAFLYCKKAVEKELGGSANMGYLIVVAYRSYQKQVGMILRRNPKVFGSGAEDVEDKMNPVHSFADLVQLAKFLGSDIYRSFGKSQLDLRDCPKCGVRYLYTHTRTEDSQRCPMCVLENKNRNNQVNGRTTLEKRLRKNSN